MAKKQYQHPIYGDGLAPVECLHHITLPPHWKRPAIRRFIASAKKAGIFYMSEGHKITLAFKSELEKKSSMGWFEHQLELNNQPFKSK